MTWIYNDLFSCAAGFLFLEQLIKHQMPRAGCEKGEVRHQLSAPPCPPGARPGQNQREQQPGPGRREPCPSVYVFQSFQYCLAR